MLTPEQRFEYFVMKALWIIMWMVLKSTGQNRDDEMRITQWRHDYYNAGGGTVETPLPKSTPST